MSYPSSPDSFTAKQDGPGNTIAAAHINVLQDFITAFTTALLTDGLEHNVFPQATADGRTLGTSAKLWGFLYAKALAMGASSELTIASGAVTVTQGYHSIDTEGDAASDDLATLTAGAGIVEGTLVILRAENVARVVTLKDGSGNLLLDGDFALSATDKTITLLYDGTNWREIARSANLTTEGSFTPTLIGTGGQSGQAYTTQVGRYVRVGNVVHFWLRLTMSTLGTVTTAAAIGGLPFTSENTANLIASAHVGNWANLGSALSYVSGIIPANSTRIELFGTTAGASLSALTQGNLANTTDLYVSGSYKAAA